MLLSIDTNLLFPALIPSHAQHVPVGLWLEGLQDSDEVALSEFVLAELYGLLRNPAVMVKPLGAPEASRLCQHFRAHPKWQCLGLPLEQDAFHTALWAGLAQAHFPRRKAYDLRLGLSLVQQGVTRFATQNVKDFQGLGFEEVFDPLPTR